MNFLSWFPICPAQLGLCGPEGKAGDEVWSLAAITKPGQLHFQTCYDLCLHGTVSKGSSVFFPASIHSCAYVMHINSLNPTQVYTFKKFLNENRIIFFLAIGSLNYNSRMAWILTSIDLLLNLNLLRTFSRKGHWSFLNFIYLLSTYLI